MKDVKEGKRKKRRPGLFHKPSPCHEQSQTVNVTVTVNEKDSEKQDDGVEEAGKCCLKLLCCLGKKAAGV